MRETGNREQGIGNSVQTGVQVVTEIAPAGSAEKQIPFGNGNQKGVAGRKKLTLAEVREKLDGQRGKRFWRNLEDLAETPEFQELMAEEFPRQAAAGEWVDAVSRRSFLKVMGASFAMAGLAGCTKQPDEPIYPYVKEPADLVLGRPMFFATAYPFPTGAVPVVVKSEAFRPIKIEGNPEHPMSKGKSDSLGQASLLDLYDPDRSKEPKFRGDSATWPDFQEQFAKAVKATDGGQGVYFLSETITSPTLAAQWKQVQAKFPNVKLVQWNPVNDDNARAASKEAFGDFYDTQYKLENADVIVSLDADFLSGIAFPGFLPMAAGFAERNRYEEGKAMNRMYVVETLPSVTGFKAAHRLALKPSQIDAFANALAAGNGGSLDPDSQKFLNAVLGDLKLAHGRAVVVVGPQSSAACHKAAHIVNAAIGAVGNTVVYTQPLAPIPTVQGEDFKGLVDDINAGKCQWLVMMGVNPLYSAPIDFDFPAVFAKVPNTVHLGMYLDETGFYSDWHINQAHYLESWTDARAYDGTISIVQPMIEPLYGGKSAHDLLQTLLDPSVSAYNVVFENAKTYIGGGAGGKQIPFGNGNQKGGAAAGAGTAAVEGKSGAGAGNNQNANGAPTAYTDAFRKALHDGWVANTAFAAANVGAPKTAPGGTTGPAAPVIGGVTQLASPRAGTEIGTTPTPASDGPIEIRFLPDPSVYDGRFANNGWLQEIPRQVTNLSWDNAALMPLPLMEKLGIEENDAIELELNGQTVIAPVLMSPGHADGAVTVHLGQGRRAEAGRVAAGVGFNAYPLRSSTAPLSQAGLTVRKGQGTYDICVTKVHNIEHRGAYAQHDLERKMYDKDGTYSLAGHEAQERSIIRYATVADVVYDKDYVEHGTSDGLTLVNKIGYNPQGETPAPEESFYVDSWSYDRIDPSTRQIQNKWGMSIDLNSCISCTACITACYAENNIAVVGREQVKIGRIMQWIRVDNYYEGDLHAPRSFFQPMLCQHCENAGCEQVCPVGATIHSPEGLNVMVYNRCVGTRYCSNNCIYKVRRFNFLLYSDYDTESLKFMRNPEVTVRSRGVMEKCSYCVQRIEAVKIDSDKNNVPIKDGQILTACQQVCPTDAIVFGNLNDPNAKVTKRKRQERDYEVLADLNYRPRTTYIAGVINPNPELV